MPENDTKWEMRISERALNAGIEVTEDNKSKNEDCKKNSPKNYLETVNRKIEATKKGANEAIENEADIIENNNNNIGFY